MELLKLISANEIIAQVAAFLLLFWLLKKLAWKRILGILDGRREHISQELKQIEEAKEDMLKAKADYELRIARIEELAGRKMQEAAEQSEKVSEQMRKQAHEQAQEIIENARASVKYELTKAKEALREEIINLALAAAETVIREKLTENSDRKIVNDFIKEIEGIE